MFEERKGVNEFYDGSNMFEGLTHVLGMPIDQINFILCQVAALVFGFLFRRFWGPEKVSATNRHIIEVVIGFSLAYFCFGRQLILLVIQSLVALILMRTLSLGIMEKSVLAFSIGFLCVCHLHRMYYDYGGYTLDITGPLMLNTQRLSSLAYNLRDGLEPDPHKLTEHMKHLGIRKPPTTLEFLSYVFYFHGLMVGPFCFYKDYIAFIEGVNLYKPSTNDVTGNHGHYNNDKGNSNHSGNNHKLPIVPESVLLSKLFTTIVFGISTVTILPHYPTSLITDPEFSNYNFAYKNFLILFTMSLVRHKYYFAWKLGEAVNTSAGLCFNGYDAEGKPRWDLTDNADIFKIEFGTSIKEVLDNWNKSTSVWLRYVVYERSRSTNLVFLFSAIWHGFYAGYYISFLVGGLYLNVSRRLRRTLRPWFQETRRRAIFYDLITFSITKMTMPYAGFPFALLALRPSLLVYWNVYFYQHITLVILYFLLDFLEAFAMSKFH